MIRRWWCRIFGHRYVKESAHMWYDKFIWHRFVVVRCRRCGKLGNYQKWAFGDRSGALRIDDFDEIRESENASGWEAAKKAMSDYNRRVN